MLFDWEIFGWSFRNGRRLVFESWGNITWVHHLKVTYSSLHDHILVILDRVGWCSTNADVAVSAYFFLKWNDFYINNDFLWRELVQIPILQAHGHHLSPLKPWLFISVWYVRGIRLFLELGGIKHFAVVILRILLRNFRWLASWLRISGRDLSQISHWFWLRHTAPAFTTFWPLLRRLSRHDILLKMLLRWDFCHPFLVCFPVLYSFQKRRQFDPRWFLNNKSRFLILLLHLLLKFKPLFIS